MQYLKRPQIINSNSFAKYCTISLSTCALATLESQAEIVTINLASVGSPTKDITGTNAGAGTSNIYVINPCGPNSGQWNIYRNSAFSLFGIAGAANGSGKMYIATNGGTASPKNFGLGATINSSSTFSNIGSNTLFNFTGTKSPDFGANSFLGFRFTSDGGASFKYGYIEATWIGSSNQFQFLSAAYENTAGVGITAGAAVPEPGTLALGSLALLAGGGAAVRRYRKQRQNQSTATSDATDPVTPVA